MKKFFAVLAAISLVFAHACGGGNDDNNNSNSPGGEAGHNGSLHAG